MTQVKGELNGNFPMTDLGEMNKILGIRVQWNWSNETLKISQGVYVDIILTQFNMQNPNPVSMPLSKDVKLTMATTPTSGIPYMKAIGSLMYAALGT